MKPLSFEQALQYCLENPDKLSTSELLNEFPQYREELEPLLAVDARLRTSLPRSMPPASKERMKRQLMERMAAQRIAEPSSGVRSQQRASGRTFPSVPRWQRLVAAAVAISMVISLVWLGAGSSLPGSPLYSVKLSTENLLLGLARDRGGLLRGHINLANVRLVDIDTMRLRDALAEAGPAFDNYDYHIGTCLDLWNASTDEPDLDLAKIIYASSVAGQQMLQGLTDAGVSLPTRLQENISAAITKVNTLNSSTAQVLSSAGVDLNSVLAGSQGILANLLTAVPARPTPTSTVLPSPTFTTGAQVSAPTLTAVLFAAQTAIAGGGDARTPGVAAAETVIAGGPFDTPLARAAMTVLALPTPVIAVEPGTATPVISTTVTVVPAPGEVSGTAQPTPSLESVGAPTGAVPTVTTIPITVPSLPTLTGVPATAINSTMQDPLVGATSVRVNATVPGNVPATVTAIGEFPSSQPLQAVPESTPVSVPTILPP